MDQLKRLMKSKVFSETYDKLISGDDLFSKEKVYLLSISQLLLTEFENSHDSFYDKLAFQIILNYSLKYDDFQPLYDYSFNRGLYPISSKLFAESLILNSMVSIIQDICIEGRYSHNGHIECKEQHDIREKYMHDDEKFQFIIAPTSYGKSSMITEHIDSHDGKSILIVVPTKSLLSQTYNNIRDANMSYRTIIHEDMYVDQFPFIAVMTQERALRLLYKHPELSFDYVYIDEAHKLFSRNSRSILLSRLILESIHRNDDCVLSFFSPTIVDGNNLSMKSVTNIQGYYIKDSMKVPALFEYSEGIEYRYHLNNKTKTDGKTISLGLYRLYSRKFFET